MGGWFGKLVDFQNKNVRMTKKKHANNGYKDGSRFLFFLSKLKVASQRGISVSLVACLCY